jgi:hypothetical protein
MSRNARKKFGSDMPKNAKKDSTRSSNVFGRNAASTPSGIASVQVNSMLVSARMTVFVARAPMRSATGTR